MDRKAERRAAFELMAISKQAPDMMALVEHVMGYAEDQDRPPVAQEHIRTAIEMIKAGRPVSLRYDNGLPSLFDAYMLAAELQNTMTETAA